jgi:hypothetical protein
MTGTSGNGLPQPEGRGQCLRQADTHFPRANGTFPDGKAFSPPRMGLEIPDIPCGDPFSLAFLGLTRRDGEAESPGESRLSLRAGWCAAGTVLGPEGAGAAAATGDEGKEFDNQRTNGYFLLPQLRVGKLT